MKYPHPSGRPVRPVQTKKQSIVWRYPAETFATPRLSPRVPMAVGDAIGYLTIQPPDEDQDQVRGIGFIVFSD